MKLDEKGRCCFFHPVFYKGLGWLGPPDAPLRGHSPGRPYYLCPTCKREYDLDGEQRKTGHGKRMP